MLRIPGEKSGRACPKCGGALYYRKTRYSVAEHCRSRRGGKRCDGRICAPRGRHVATPIHAPTPTRTEAAKLFCSLFGPEVVRAALDELAPAPKPRELTVDELLAELKKRAEA